MNHISASLARLSESDWNDAILRTARKLMSKPMDLPGRIGPSTPVNAWLITTNNEENCEPVPMFYSESLFAQLHYCFSNAHD